jgi:hypothetical protein
MNAFFNRAYAHEHKGDRPRAIADYERVLEIGAKQPDDEATVTEARRRLAALRGR